MRSGETETRGPAAPSPAAASIYRVFDYDRSRYDFIRLVSDVFGTEHLEELHLHRQELLPLSQLDFENESRTKFHQTFYERLNSGWNEFYEIYDTFVRQVIENHVEEEAFLYQYLPSFRIQLPGDRAIHRWHCDSDQDHRHPEGEVNFQIALTDCFGSNATWIESDPGKGDYYPIELRTGQCARFDGSRLVHGNKVNQTGLCRLSFDFRVLPLSRYDPGRTEPKSPTARKRFIIGEYYKYVGK